MTKRLTTEEFCKRARIKHGNKYDYSITQYFGSQIKVKIICKIHGIFTSTPENHIQGSGCPLCGIIRAHNTQTSSTENFIHKANRVHNSKYQYIKSVYVGNKKRLIITCPIHGDFLQIPNSHLRGNGCSKCSNNKKLTMLEFIEKANHIHDNRYDYSLVQYVNTTKKIKIICKIHGVYFQIPNDHLQSAIGCPSCAHINRRMNVSQFIEKATSVHGEQYDYSSVQYVSFRRKVKIICKLHGSFLQTPQTHLCGSGCCKCIGTVSKREQQWLDQMNVPNTPHHRQAKPPHLNHKLTVDGFDPITNTVYEFWGDYWHGNPTRFASTSIHPTIKKTFGELYQKTLEKRQTILNAGYNLVEMWESDWIALQKSKLNGSL